MLLLIILQEMENSTLMICLENTLINGKKLLNMNQIKKKELKQI